MRAAIVCNVLIHFVGHHEDIVPAGHVCRFSIVSGPQVLDLNLCAFLPKQNCDTDLDASSFVALPLKPVLTRTVYVASLEARSKSPFVKALIREVISVFKEKSAEKSAAA